jgi:hypothetical protein
LPKNERNKGFGYLLSMNIMTFSSERMAKLENMIETKNQEIKKLQNSSIEELWIEDLRVFEEYYKEKCLKIPKDDKFNLDEEMIDVVKMPVVEHRKVINNLEVTP